MSIARLMQMARAGVPAGGGDEWTDPDLANASYDSVSFSVAGEDSAPFGVSFNNDGSKMYMVGTVTDSVFQYTLSTGFDISTASYDSVSFSVASQEASPRGLAFKSDGAKMYVVGNGTQSIYQYSTA
jgi:DNA-binding beta-propeller fold protein YncE